MLIRNILHKNLLQNSNLAFENKISSDLPKQTSDIHKSQWTVSSDLLKAYSPINFKGSSAHDLIMDLKTMHDVHCPICGVKMLPKNNFLELLNEGTKINNPKEFVSWLKKNNEFIPENLKSFTESAKRISEMTMVSDTDKLFDLLQEQATFNLKISVEDMKKTIFECEKTNNFNESDKMLLDECIVRLETLDLSEDFIKNIKQILNDTIKNLENEAKKSLYFKLKNDAIAVGLLPRTLHHTDYENKEDRQRKILKSLFTSSVQNIAKFYTEIEDESKFWGNIILTCANCEKLPLASVFTNYTLKPELKNNYETFLTDISRNILNNDKYKKHMDYPFQSAGLIKHLTKKGLLYKFNTNQILSNIKVENFQTKRSEIDFPLVKHDGVPCSTCGMPTITHEKKKSLYQKILDKKNMTELMYFLDLNYRRLNREYKPMAKFFAAEVKKNPNISEAEMYKKLRQFLTDDLNRQIELNLEWCDEIRAQLTNPEDIEYLEKYRKTVQEKYRNLGRDEKFDYHPYKDLLSETIYKISDPRIRMIYGARLKETIRKRMRTRLLLFPNKETVEKIGSPIKLWAQDLFKGSVATVDHLVAKNIHGDDSLSNFSVMCKSCNTEKSNYNMLHWYGLHNKDIAHNMQRYLDYVIYLIKSGREQNLGNYPKEFVENVYNVTQGKIALNLNKLPKKFITETNNIEKQPLVVANTNEIPELNEIEMDVDLD